MSQTLGKFLINDLLPAKHRVTGTLNKKEFQQKMLDLAQEDPAEYVEIVSKLKTLGDDISTLEGISVGLDDITPEYKSRDGIMAPGVAAMKNAVGRDAKEKIILDVQKKMLEHTRTHPGSMTAMALSGARGNIPQLMKTIASPVATTTGKGDINPWLISKSYAEGLSAADHWAAGNEARHNTVQTYTAIAEPGDMSKVMTNNMYPLVITIDDCGTHNGLALNSSDGNIVDRYLSQDQAGYHRNDVVTKSVASKLQSQVKTVYVRSPMTCAAKDGICRKCQGLDERGRPHAIGINVGVRAAQSISEPLTQMALGAKHGMRVLKGASPKLEGIAGIRQLLEVPQSFINKAPLAEHAGTVTRIVPAPHGGTHIYVDAVQHYAGPNLKILVHPGQKVEAGDVLSEGIPKPDELIAHKGFGVGRQYLVDTLHDIYRGQGINVDKRHLELVARADLNHIKVLEHTDSHPELVKGEVLPYTMYRDAAAAHSKLVPLGQAQGGVLGKEVLHFTTGTPLTASVLEKLKEHKISEVSVATSLPRVEFLMRPMARNPLLHPDWMARLAHRYLKDSLLQGARTGATSDRHSTHPVPAYAYGAEFGMGPEGRY
jgi:DNA-directed RNA polymerase subunit beta'